MFNTIGERITYCRNLLGLARNELAKRIGDSISLPTIARWELNTVVPSATKIESLASFFSTQGLTVSVDWLKNGKGQPPLSMDLEKFDSSQFDELSYVTLMNISNKVKDFFFKQINSNFFRPIASFGDYAGGILESNLKSIDNKLCIISMNNLVTVGIYCYASNAIANMNGEIQELNDEVQIGEAQWILRRP